MSEKIFKEELIEELLKVKNETEIPKIAKEILKACEYENEIPDIVTIAKKFDFMVAEQQINNGRCGGYAATGKAVYKYIEFLKKTVANTLYKSIESWKIIAANTLYSPYDMRYNIAICLSYYLLNSSSKYSEFYFFMDNTKKEEYKMAIELAENILVPNELLASKIEELRYSSYFLSELSEYFKLPKNVILSIIAKRIKK